MRTAVLCVLVAMLCAAQAPGDHPPVLVSRTPPEYTDDARQAKVEGTIVLYAEIWPDGRAHNLKVVRELGHGLDAKAVDCVSEWRFKPAVKNGETVRMAATIEVNFRLPKN